jgi:uncharacterized protein (DUF1810 family)
VNTFNIYPNPTSSYIHISGLEKAENYFIYNILVAKIKTGTIDNQQTIDVQNVAKRLYLLKFENGNIIKFIKE